MPYKSDAQRKAVFSKKQINHLKNLQVSKNVYDNLSNNELQSQNQRKKQLLLRDEKIIYDNPKNVIIGFKKGGQPIFA